MTELTALQATPFTPIVYTSANPSDLITLDEYKNINSLKSNNSDDQIQLLIPAISQLVKNYCNSPILDNYFNDYTEYFDIQWLTYTVQLRLSPIIGISGVWERSTMSSEYEQLTENVNFWVDHVSDSVFKVNDAGAYINWNKGAGAVKVVYRAGHRVTPPDLKYAVSDLITYYLKDERKDRRTLGAASIDYANDGDNGNFPDYIRRVLDIYKI